jgi:hypothetical protein
MEASNPFDRHLNLAYCILPYCAPPYHDPRHRRPKRFLSLPQTAPLRLLTSFTTEGNLHGGMDAVIAMRMLCIAISASLTSL